MIRIQHRKYTAVIGALEKPLFVKGFCIIQFLSFARFTNVLTRNVILSVDNIIDFCYLSPSLGNGKLVIDGFNQDWCSAQGFPEP